jgi:hypothetical protein
LNEFVDFVELVGVVNECGTYIDSDSSELVRIDPAAITISALNDNVRDVLSG